MYLPTQLLYERPATPVVYDTPPFITRRRPLLLRALDALRPERRRAALEAETPRSPAADARQLVPSRNVKPS